MWVLGRFFLMGCLVLVSSTRAQQEARLEIPQGQLKGIRTETMYHNKPYYSFKGIPYAKPNVGPNKFQMPEPADSWEGVYDATVHRNACPFHCMIQKQMIGNEDCLYLNVYTPVLDKEAGKAVMVWIHPGGWNGGFSHTELFAPDFLVEQDVVVVTFNFRLGAIGFLNTGDKNAPGNAGMKDQVMALKWVKDNIHYFGGCPNRVTIFGASSGGASVQYHMLSPMSEGLFRGVIAQSGSILNPWAISYNPRELSFKLGEILGIKTTDSKELVEKLSEIDPEQLIAATNQIMADENTADGHMYAFVPTVEADLGQDIFLPADPWTLIKTGSIMDVPVMAGVALNEAAFFAKTMSSNMELLKDQPEMFLPIDLNVTDATKRKELGESLRNFYFGDKPLGVESMNEYAMMMSDQMFDAGTALSLQIINSRNSAPVYEYLFTYEGSFGIMKSIVDMPDGVAHGDEIGYLFYSNVFKNMPEPGSDAEKMTHIMTKLWTNFAKDTNPTSNMDEYVKVNWEPMGKEDNYMNINTEPKMEKDLFKERMDFWRNIYRDVLGNYA